MKLHHLFIFWFLLPILATSSCQKQIEVVKLDIKSECLLTDNDLVITSFTNGRKKFEATISDDGLLLRSDTESKVKNVPWSFVNSIAVDRDSAEDALITSLETHSENYVIGSLSKECFDKFLTIAPRRIGIKTIVRVRDR